MDVYDFSIKNPYNGHVILAQRKTSDSHCFDPVLLYFRACCVKNSIEHKFYDSKGDWAHAFECKINGHKYQIRWQGESGRYSVVTDNQVQNRSAEELLKFMDDIINPV